MLSLTLVGNGIAVGQEFVVEKEDMPEKKSEYSPYVDQYFPQRVFFGGGVVGSSVSLPCLMTFIAKAIIEPTSATLAGSTKVLLSFASSPNWVI